MKLVVRPIPVVFACRGCALDAVAREMAAELERRGLAEAALAGRDAAKARSRFPVYALEGCDRCCAAQWLASEGVRPQRSLVLDPQAEPQAELERILTDY